MRGTICTTVITGLHGVVFISNSFVTATRVPILYSVIIFIILNGRTDCKTWVAETQNIYYNIITVKTQTNHIERNGLRAVTV